MPADMTLRTAYGGALVNTPAGACFRSSLDAVTAAFHVPAGVRFGEVFATFPADS